jgi:hypothetical protein
MRRRLLNRPHLKKPNLHTHLCRLPRRLNPGEPAAYYIDKFHHLRL